MFPKSRELALRYRWNVICGVTIGNIREQSRRSGPLNDALSIVVPVYNSEDSLPLLFARLDAVLPTVARQFEVILVNDGSRDGTEAVLDREAARYPWAAPIHLMRNYGQHNALLCGIRAAKYETIVTMDDDLQNPPEEIPRLLEKLNEGYDVVYGYPRTESHGLFRDFASRITKMALQAGMGVDVASRVSSFRAFRTMVREGFADYRGAFVSIDVLLSWCTTRFAAIPVENPPREIGPSNYTIRKLVRHAMNMMTGFTVLPLQVASILGFAFAVFGFFTLVYVVGRYFINGHNVPGFAFLASIFSIFSGVQLFSLGIFGEYLARVHFRVMDRPTYAQRVTEPKKNAAHL
jgi:undecaprenyl-phosphate 4-deoxy-4-formamido-L-arabinose transferase